jgi:ATP-dependent Clp protease ATP-binding subunit ClpC
VFEKYTEKSRRTIFFARYEASMVGSPVIDTEHLLLGVLREAPGILQKLGVRETVQDVQARIRALEPKREKIPTSVDLPFSPAARQALEAAYTEAEQARSAAIRTQHLCLGLLHAGGSVAASILGHMGVTLEGARTRLLDQDSPAGADDAPNAGERAVPNEDFRRAVWNALEEASLLSRDSACPEHLLLGILRNTDSRAAQILKGHGLSLDGLRERLKNE